MTPSDASKRLNISVVYSPRAREVDETMLSLEQGATVADALRESALQSRHAELVLDVAAKGIWGTPCDASTVLRDRDRVEVYRDLLVDPKEARRLRYQGQKATSRTRKP
jgi:putative ubiquitin-RnfH superfamily antitoxin RatB of RatAB toxin-antitoxin module